MSDADFLRPSAIERGFNRMFGLMVRAGLALPHNYLLEVRGRKSGKLYAAPIDLVTLEGRRYLVCPRGRSQWVRNAEAAGRVALRKAFVRHEFAIRALSDSEKLPILKAYLDRYKTTVQRYFPLPAGAPVEAFAEFAARYPVFKLIPVTNS
jgi:deazaflavin-dependent oxidoreductase (nitroreductase family)